MIFQTDDNDKVILCFTPKEGITISAGDFTPTRSTVYKLASAVTITLDSVAVDYEAFDEICLIQGITYTFSDDVDAHRM